MRLLREDLAFANINYCWLFSDGKCSPRCALIVWSAETRGFPSTGRAGPIAQEKGGGVLCARGVSPFGIGCPRAFGRSARDHGFAGMNQPRIRPDDQLLSDPVHPGLEPIHNAAERALAPAVIQRRSVNGAPSAKGAICRGRLLIVITILRQVGCEVWAWMEKA